METFRIEFRQRLQNRDDDWGRWQDLDHEDYESVEDAREALDEERVWDEKVSSKLWNYDYRIVDISGLERVVVEADDSSSEALADDLGSVSVPVERLELLEGIEGRLKGALEEKTKEWDRARKTVDEAMIPSMETILAKDDAIRLYGEIKLIKTFLKEG